MRTFKEVKAQQLGVGIALCLLEEIRQAAVFIGSGNGRITILRIGVGVFAVHVKNDLTHIGIAGSDFQHALHNQLDHIGFAQAGFAEHGGALTSDVHHRDVSLVGQLQITFVLACADQTKVDTRLRIDRAIDHGFHGRAICMKYVDVLHHVIQVHGV